MKSEPNLPWHMVGPSINPEAVVVAASDAMELADALCGAYEPSAATAASSKKTISRVKRRRRGLTTEFMLAPVRGAGMIERGR